MLDAALPGMTGNLEVGLDVVLHHAFGDSHLPD